MDFFARSLFTVGLASMIGAVVGGGLKAFGVEFPLLASKARQGLLGIVGLGMVGLAIMLQIPPRPAVSSSPSLTDAAQLPKASLSPEHAAGASQTTQTISAEGSRAAELNAKGPVSGCPSAEQALNCLPHSSRRVAFADPEAANSVAWANVRSGLSTSQAEAISIRRGASGRAARLCGIMESNDSSPLALHLAAVKLNGDAGSQGVVDDVCTTVIGKLL